MSDRTRIRAEGHGASQAAGFPITHRTLLVRSGSGATEIQLSGLLLLTAPTQSNHRDL